MLEWESHINKGLYVIEENETIDETYVTSHLEKQGFVIHPSLLRYNTFRVMEKFLSGHQFLRENPNENRKTGCIFFSI